MSCETVGILNMLQPHMNACIGISQQSNSFMWTAFHLIPCRASKFFLFSWSWWWWLFSIRNNYPRLDLFSIISLMRDAYLDFPRVFSHLILWWPWLLLCPFVRKMQNPKKLIYDIHNVFQNINRQKKTYLLHKHFYHLCILHTNPLSHSKFLF